MARIAVDMDDTIADALGELLRRYNNAFGTKLDSAQLVGKNLYEVLPSEHYQACHDMVHCEDFFENLEVLDSSQEVLQRLSQQHEIYIVTAAMEVPASLAPKFRWLQRHFSFISPMNYIFCGDKHLIAADYLIDDNPRHFKLFPGEGILFDAPHNRNVAGYRRVHTWFEVESMLASPH